MCTRLGAGDTMVESADTVSVLMDFPTGGGGDEEQPNRNQS